MDRRNLIVGLVIGFLFGFGVGGIILGVRLHQAEALHRQQLAIIREDAAHARQSLRDAPKTWGIDWCDAELESIEQVTRERK